MSSKETSRGINPLFSGAAHSDVPKIQAVPEKQPPLINRAALDLYLGKPAATPNLTANSIGPEMQSENIPDSVKASSSPFSRIGTAVPHRKFSQRKFEDGQRIIFERESCASRYVTVASVDKQTETFEVSRNGTIIRKMEVLPVRVKERYFENEALPAPTEQYEAEADVPESSGRATERPKIARKPESEDLEVPFDPLPSGLLFTRGPELRMHARGKRPPEYKPRKERQELSKRPDEAQAQHCLVRPDVEKVIGGSEDLRVEEAPAQKKKLFSHAAILSSYAPSGAHTTQNIQISKLQSPPVDIFQI
ncbi:unnamed protein product, partial [Mesorhabditis spiculigera]